jgi:hypothetical protein
MEVNHNTDDFSGLESLSNSQVVTNIGEFLSLDALGVVQDANDGFIALDSINKVREDETPVGVDPLVPGTPPVTPQTIELPTLKIKDEGLDNLDDLNKGVEDLENIIPESTNYKTMLSDLIDQGILPAIDAFETEQGDVPFDEMDIDKETFLALIKQNQQDIKDSFKETSIDVNGISEFTKKLINIEKHGGDVQQALETYQQVKYPMDSIDLNDVRGQKAMCYLRLQAQGIDEKMAKDLIQSFELQGVLEERALESKEQLDHAFTESIARQEELAIKEEQEYKAALKTYRATLDNVFKDQNLPDTHRRKLLDIATKQNERGDFELDTLIENFRKNPIDAADLIMFVTNKDEFIKNKSQSLVKQEHMNTLKKVSIIRKGSNTLTVPEKTIDKDPHLLDLSRL